MYPRMNYLESTIPPEMTVAEWRRRRPAQSRHAVKPRPRRLWPLIRRAD